MTDDTSAADEPIEDEPAARAWRAMRALLFDHNDRRQQVSQALDLSFIRAKALVRLHPAALTMRELATALATDAPYTSVVVDDLQRRALVERSTHPIDRRVKVVSLTELGAEYAARAEAIQNEPPEVLRGLSGPDLDALNRILAGLVAGAEHAN